jgi:hypothetical protein
MKWAAAAVALAACAGREPPSDCGGDLRGVWGTDDGRRFDVILTERGWEMFPMFDDRPRELPPGVVAAPSMLELPATGEDPLEGTFTRRYERGAKVCRTITVARLHDCRGGRAALDVAPPPPPDFTTCTDAPTPVTLATETWPLLRE